jgi:multiple sugar transport system substrate-binding protein
MRRGASLATAVVLALAAGACSQPASQGEVLHFTMWKPNQPAVWDAAIAKFEAIHPGVTVEREIGPHSSTAFHDLLAQKLKNRDPQLDVYLMDVIWPAEFGAAGWARDLTSELPPAERDKFLPGTIAANTWRGRLYGVPFYIDAGLLYYREDLLAAHGFDPPETWQELAKQARAIVAAESEEAPALVGYVGQFKQYEGLVCNMLEFVVSNGGAFVDPSGHRATLAETADVEAVRWVRDDLVGEVAPRAVLTYEEPESLAAFIQGNAVFQRSWPYVWEIANDPQRSRIAGKVGTTALPHFPGHASASALGGWQVGISAFSRHPDLAWAFVSFLTSSAMQKTFAVDASLAPTRTGLYHDPEVIAANPQFAAQAAAFLNAVPRPVTPMYPAVSAVLQRTFSEILAGGAAIEPALERADREIDRFLEMTPSGG